LIKLLYFSIKKEKRENVLNNSPFMK